MKSKMSKELSNHRLEQAKEDLDAIKFLYDGKFYKSANNNREDKENMFKNRTFVNYIYRL